MICGCSLLTFVLSCIIALLSAAVIGLAAGTGIEASRANDAVHKLAAYTSANPVQIATTSTFPGTSTTATMTSTGSIGGATSPSGVEVDSGCGSRSDQVNGTTYTSLKCRSCLFPVLIPFDVPPEGVANTSERLALDQRSYRIYCFRDYNRDTTNSINLVAIFTADFEACMDACASWTKYVVPKSNSKDPGWDCGAVSFIPAWVNRSTAEAGRYTGNCYLKTGPASIGKLEKNSNVHAALWQSG